MKQSSIQKVLWLTAVVASTLVAASLHVHSEAPEQGNRPNVVHSQDDGGVHYSDGRFVEYGFHQDKAEPQNTVVHLSDFRLVLNAEAPQRYHGTLGGQVMLPVSNSTVYQDLDGDSILDTMTKNGPEGYNSYILYHEHWVEVSRTMTGFAVGRPMSSLDGKIIYIFSKGQWRIRPGERRYGGE